MNFSEAESYLLSLGNEVETMKLGLDNIRRLLSELGNPQSNYLKVQIAGTNGKGSVCAFLKSICLEAGINAGVYTSPHLTSITERINIGGVDISEDDFARLATRVRETSEKLAATGDITNVPTFFEQVTTIALLAFAEAKIQLAILETGLGGRLDATTAANAEIAAITRIDIDHQEYLGETIEEIAAEKAAIIQDHTAIAVLGKQKPEVDAVLEGHVDRLSREKSLENYGIQVLRTEKPREAFQTRPFNPSILGLKGRHQIENSRIAIMTAVGLSNYLSVTSESILAGLEKAKHPGRIEYIGKYILDGAHNVSAAVALVTYLILEEQRRLTLVFSALQGKDVNHIAGILFPRSERIVLTQSTNSRSIKASNLFLETGAEYYGKPVIVTESVAEAIQRATSITPDGDLILVTGSLYLVGEARRILIEKSEI